LGTFKKKVKTKNPTTTTNSDSTTEEIAIGHGEAEIRLSSSSYDGACSALNHLFIESFIEKDVNVVTKDLWLRLSRYKKGMRRKGAQQKGELGLSLAEGKKPLPIAAYKELARILFESEKPEHVAAHAFLILAWNLIARAEFVVDVKIDAIYFQNDAIMIDMGKTKTDQDGTKNIDHPWHLYANNHCPYICPVLAIARHLSMTLQLEEMQRSLNASFEATLKRELDNRNVGGSVNAHQLAEINNQLTTLVQLAHSNNANVNQNNGCDGGDGDEDGGDGADGFKLFHDESGDDIIGIPDSIGDGTSDQLVRAHIKKQLKRRRFTVGFHNNKFNVLPALWRYPKGVTLIHLMNLWLIGVKNDNVPPLGILDTQSFKHFDNNARRYSTFKQVMVIVERFGRERGVWLEDRNNWDGKFVTALWSAIWHDMYPYMNTKTTKVVADQNNPEQVVQSVSYNKSRTGQISVRSVYNKLCAAGMFGEGNRVRKRRKIS
jgi:hypothetical protein